MVTEQHAQELVDQLPGWHFLAVSGRYNIQIACDAKGHRRTFSAHRIHEIILTTRVKVCISCAPADHYVNEAATLLATKGPGWTLSKYHDCMYIEVRCPEGHDRSIALQSLRKIKNIQCHTCNPYDPTPYIKEAKRLLTRHNGWTFDRYVNADRVYVRCPDGGHTKQMKLSDLRRRHTLACVICHPKGNEAQARTLVAAKGAGWVMTAYHNARAVDLTCPNGHDRTITLQGLRRLKKTLVCQQCRSVFPS